MTDDGELRRRRDAAYTERVTLMRLRGALLDAAEATGLRPEDSLPEPLARAYAAYTARINDLNVVIADLDRRIAANRGNE
ncbi:hypothetical protein [Mycobacterium sp. 852002-51057_SCH5723018]|uniref:hypothetical protein n=1 Tax=Mycobacterium sp. 852002-51057_SCH5723018 TaxID=1834094 RepID=UPI00080209B9|nr:hypothetical protein [Mycobacterium sp. 852002-51057_SCH5723018]OBG20580.1 hypothetical protein A5764_01485 [Mycobacterium sp. 852002-51057_SCH5723018]